MRSIAAGIRHCVPFRTLAIITILTSLQAKHPELVPVEPGEVAKQHSNASRLLSETWAVGRVCSSCNLRFSALCWDGGSILKIRR